MAISRHDCWSFITELVTRNPNLGIAALEDGLFVNMLIFNYFRAAFDVRLNRSSCVSGAFELVRVAHEVRLK